MAKSNITTIKLEKDTKNRLDSLKEYPRESYEEVINKIINIINITIKSPVSGARIFRNIKRRKAKKGEVYQSREPEAYQEKQEEKQS